MYLDDLLFTLGREQKPDIYRFQKSNLSQKLVKKEVLCRDNQNNTFLKEIVVPEDDGRCRDEENIKEAAIYASKLAQLLNQGKLPGYLHQSSMYRR